MNFYEIRQQFRKIFKNQIMLCIQILQKMNFQRRSSKILTYSDKKISNFHLSDMMKELSNNTTIRNSQKSLRNSNNSFEVQSIIKFSQKNEIRYQFIQKMWEELDETVIVVGICLPSEQLQKVYHQLTKTKEKDVKKVIFDQQENTMYLAYSQILNEKTVESCQVVILMIEENQLTHKNKTIFEIFKNICQIIITNENFIMHQRLQIELSHPHLLKVAQTFIILYEQKQPSNIGSLKQSCQSVFTYQFKNIEKIDVPRKAEIKKDRRNSDNQYDDLIQQFQMKQQFIPFFKKLAKGSLKKNFQYSKCIWSKISVYLLNIWLQQSELNQYHSIVQNTLQSYEKQMQNQFIKSCEKLPLPVDQLSLRNNVENLKKQLFFDYRKNLIKFSTILDKDMMEINLKKQIEKYSRYVNEKSREFYLANDKAAHTFNLTILNRLYHQFINNEARLQEDEFDEEMSNRTLQTYENEFKEFLNCYGAESIRSSSQLKTFNQFMIHHKKQYIQTLSFLLKKNKKNSTLEKEEVLKDKISIHEGILQNLESQIKELQEKRKKNEEQNEIMKLKINDFHREMRSEKQFSIRKNKRDNSEMESSRSIRKDQKKSEKFSKSTKFNFNAKKQNERKCCCELM